MKLTCIIVDAMGRLVTGIRLYFWQRDLEFDNAATPAHQFRGGLVDGTGWRFFIITSPVFDYGFRGG